MPKTPTPLHGPLHHRGLKPQRRAEPASVVLPALVCTVHEHRDGGRSLAGALARLVGPTIVVAASVAGAAALAAMAG